MKLTERQRFEAKYSIDSLSNCWLWHGAITDNGYATFTHDRKTIHAHRFSFLIHRGDIPAGKHVCHSCDIRNCVNPDHLWIGTRFQNMQDAVLKGRIAYGERAGHSKLNTDLVRRIRRSSECHRVLSEKFGVATSVISNVKNRKTWRHI